MLGSLKRQRRSKKKVQTALTTKLWEVQAIEWALLYLQSPTKGEGEKWRMFSPRTIERALIEYKKILAKKLRKYDLYPRDIKPLKMTRKSKGSNQMISKKFLSPPIKTEEEKAIEKEESRLRRARGLKKDPRFEELSAIDLYNLSRFGDIDETGI